MRPLELSIVFLSAVTLAACGDNLDGSTGDDDDVAVDAPAGADGPGGDVDAPAGGVTCGATVCGATQECCTSGAPACVDLGTCNGVAFACDGIEDCATAGDVCCVAGGPGGAACEPGAGCQTPTCVTAADCPNANQECCPAGEGFTSVCAVNCPGV